MSIRPKRVALVANSSWYLYNFRRTLAKAFLSAGHDVIFIAPPDLYSRKLVEEGFAFKSWNLRPSSLNPVRELWSVLDLSRALRAHGTEVVCSYTPKGNVYAGMALLTVGGRLLPNVSGLGRVFSNPGLLASFVKVLYRLALGPAPHVYFQNEDDRDLFVRTGVVRRDRTERLMGSGVDLQHFQQIPLPSEKTDTLSFLMVARLLREKGIFEYVEAARCLRKEGREVQCLVLGTIAAGAAGAPTRQELQTWEDQGLIRYLGSVDDVRPAIAQADCLVLPSFYREGVPRSLLEGAACGRPCITTDMPGCRDVVEPGVTGFLCESRSVESLTQCMRAFIAQSPSERRQMSNASRARAEAKFSEASIIRGYLAQVNL